MLATPTSPKTRSTVIEKGAAAILSALVIAGLSWTASSVQQSQLQYARIEERLKAQNDTLIQIKKTIETSDRHYDVLDQRLRSHDTRLTILETQLKRLEKRP